ncbi:hypothetical protein TgHK011_007654 [Trichoderma gracile]|nr:hypothetical protein TgHK011_007654 [Trichoderma gracile]
MTGIEKELWARLGRKLDRPSALRLVELMVQLDSIRLARVEHNSRILLIALSGHFASLLRLNGSPALRVSLESN